MLAYQSPMRERRFKFRKGEIIANMDDPVGYFDKVNLEIGMT